MKTQYDIVIVGGGLGGLTCALACAYKGAKVAVIDAADPKALLKADFDGAGVCDSRFELSDVSPSGYFLPASVMMYSPYPIS